MRMTVLVWAMGVCWVSSVAFAHQDEQATLMMAVPPMSPQNPLQPTLAEQAHHQANHHQAVHETVETVQQTPVQYDTSKSADRSNQSHISQDHINQDHPSENHTGDSQTNQDSPAQAKLPAIDSEQFIHCTQIDNHTRRLACFDALAKHSTALDFYPKRAVHLGDTFKNTLAGKIQLALTGGDSELEETQDGGQVLTGLGFSKQALARYTPLSLAYDLDKNSERGLWTARPHNANYLLPLFFNLSPNRQPHTPNQPIRPYRADEMRVLEVKFQLSLKAKTMENVFDTDADLWFGYTQLSHWQVYNKPYSRPFRTHDYQPEVFLTQPVAASLPFDGQLRMLGIGAIHHSNGESDPLSRSWNRLYITGGAQWGNLTVMPRLWARLTKHDPNKPNDNPDISDYYGYGDVKFLYQLRKGNNISGLVRFNPMTGKGAVQLDYVHPLNHGISGFAQVFHGYGQSLIDYNYKTSSVGIGIMLTDWLGL